MNQRDLDLALKKQRLVLRSAALRVHPGRELGAVKPLFSSADRVREAAHWLRQHLHLVSLAAAVVALVRPRLVFRWGRRGFVLWQTLSKLRRRLATP